MVPLQKLLGKEDKFFDLFEASAGQARESVRALRKFLQNPGPNASLEDFAATRRKDKAITAEINETLCTNVVSSFEPADIEALSNSIYKIPKTCEKIAERILLAPQHLDGVDLSPQIVMLEKATDTLLQMVKELRKGLSRTRVTTLNQQLQTVEGEADKTTNELLRGLYNAAENPGRILFLKDIYELLEKVTDRCRDAGNVVLQVVLKGA
jgi:uncharacterized protein Yka (UPF0111/DUF47 family)